MLPIFAIQSAFFDALQDSTPLVIHAPTGSGKSTQIPLWLQQHLDGPIVVVQPRRIACHALATYLAQQKAESVGQSIGYSVRFESQVSTQTTVIFVTPGVALRMLQEPESRRYVAWMLDEFHERSWELDLLLACLRKRQKEVASTDAASSPPTEAKQKHRQDGASSTLAEIKQKHRQDGGFALILTSATLEAEGLCQSLGAVLLRTQGRGYPVSVHYAEEPAQPSLHDLEQRATSAIDDFLQKHPDDTGDILFFLPGKAEIDRCRQALLGLAKKHHLQITPLHGTLPMQQLTQALAPQSHSRRLYLSTNVAETSLTLPNVTTVLDSGLARMRIHRGGQSALAVVEISRAQMDQRAGRAGRIASGRCIRLWQERYTPEPEPKPEIERIELDDLLLQAASIGLQGKAFFEAPWICPPPTFAYQRALRRLQEVGAIATDVAHTEPLEKKASLETRLDLHDRDRSGFYLTSLGSELARWPIPALEAYLLLGAPDALQPILADLVALLQQSRADLLLPLHLFAGDQRDDIHEARRTLLSAYPNEVYTQIACLRSKQPQRLGLHDQTLTQARAIAKQLRTRLRLSPTSPEQDESPFPSTDALARWLLQRNPSLGFVLRERALKPQRNPRYTETTQPWANGDIEAQWEPFQPWSEETPPPVRAGVILQIAWLASSATRIGAKARMLLPCSLQTLAAAGLGEPVAEQPTLHKKPDGTVQIVAQVSQDLAGVRLTTTEAPLQGALLREACVFLIAQDRLWKGLWDILLDRLHLIHLANDLSETPTALSSNALPTALSSNALPTALSSNALPTDPQVFLSTRLQEIGLEQNEDLPLLSPDDILPDLLRWTGLHEWDLQELETDFPRRWFDQGGTYRCTVRPKTRRVILEPLDATAKKAPDPSPQRLPRFRNFHVDFQKASRLITLRGTPHRS